MKITTVKKLQEVFLGKVCTVMTAAACKKDFTEVQFADFFTGIMESIDDDGAFLRHHITRCKSFFPISSMVAILEEQTVTQDDPNFDKVAEHFRKVMSEKSAKPVEPRSPFVDQEMLANLARQAKS